jgi:L-fucose mutarotase
MLIGIDPLLSGDALAILRDMGHGDCVAVVDANFPASYLGPPVVRLDVDIVRAGRALLGVLPLDAFVDAPLVRMEVIGRPSEVVEAQAEFIAMAELVAGTGWPVGSLERFAFYEAARDCVAIFATLDRRSYANFILHKGVIGPDDAVVRAGPGTQGASRRAEARRVSAPRPLGTSGRR